MSENKNGLSGLDPVPTDKSKNSLPGQRKLGRKAKPLAEKASEAITLKFTKAELALIEDKSGLVAKATFLKDLLVRKTDLLK